ncbi:hypothetical protein NKW44_09135 [Acetobacter lovaniensis]|uniref:hypothetical protein n=1 Tax=Acetobacter lovaniensis TaxID=104100 RepID=UPI00209FE589|nr:hypothetical protein [Acetobacter lovaniensis]MCP1239857.1 hypothetical protein [Acetobacter lovaniensis]
MEKTAQKSPYLGCWRQKCAALIVRARNGVVRVSARACKRVALSIAGLLLQVTTSKGTDGIGRTLSNIVGWLLALLEQRLRNRHAVLVRRLLLAAVAPYKRIIH